MTSSKSTKKKKNKGGGAGSQQFLLWHGEKIAVGVVIVLALWIAGQGFQFLGKPFTWTPDELETFAKNAKTEILKERKAIDEEGVGEANYATLAEQIKEPVKYGLYQAGTWWNPGRNFYQPPSTPPASQPGG